MIGEWANDLGTREEIVVRCTKCGWDGAGQMVTQYGCSMWIPESCPVKGCGMDTEPSDVTFDDPPDEEDQDEIDTESDEEEVGDD